jgi:HEAT repeat protein
VNGTVISLTLADVTLLRRVLRDATDDDTIRNEAANHLRAHGAKELADDCSAVLAQAGELPRFRSFAAQHLGIAWLDARSGDAARAVTLRMRMVALLSDRDIEVRREALLALARGDDPDGLRTAAAWLTDPSPAADSGRDLAIRIAGERLQMEHIPRIRAMGAHELPVIRAAAILALGQLRDEASRPLIAAAVQNRDPQVASAARGALAALDQPPTPAPATSATPSTTQESL